MDFPPASEICVEISQTKEQSKNFKQKTREEHLERMTNASGQYYDFVLKECKNGINYARENGKYHVILFDLGKAIKNGSFSVGEKKVPIHVLHYGHQGGHWTTRTALEVDNAFIKAQKMLKKSGYYLVDESDPEKSLMIRISLYIGQDSWNKRHQTNLWHKLDKVSDDE